MSTEMEIKVIYGLVLLISLLYPCYGRVFKHKNEMTSDAMKWQNDGTRMHLVVSQENGSSDESDEKPALMRIPKIFHETDPARVRNGRLKINRQQARGFQAVNIPVSSHEDVVNKIYKNN